MIKKVFRQGMLRQASIAIASALLPAIGLAAPGTVLNKVSLARDDGGVRITLETSAPTTEHVLHAQEARSRRHRPARHALAKGTRMPAGIGNVDTMRTGPRPNDTLRVVIELKSAATLARAVAAGVR